jgi:predicted DNA-binding transcriptional regulator YafY
MPKSYYKQVDRLTGMMDLLLHTQTQVSLLAGRYTTSSRTIYRDLEVLRELGYPLLASAGGRVGPDRAAVRAAPLIHMAPAVVNALFVAVRQAERSRPHSIAASKLATVLSACETLPMSRVWKLIADEATPQPGGDSAVLQTLLEASASQRVCEIEYLAMTAESHRPMRFAPVEILPGLPARVTGFVEDERRGSLLELRRIRSATLLEAQRPFRRAGARPSSTVPERKRARVEDNLLRFLAILSNRKGADYSNLAEIASLFQCAEITARRNVDRLTASGFGHMLEREGRGTIPPVLFTAGERREILSAVRQCKPDHPLGRELEEAERQLKGAGDVAHLVIEVRADPVPPTGPFWVLVEAIRKRRRCWITYVGHWGNETREFAFDPGVLELDEVVRVSGHVVGNPEPKCLTVGRMAQVHLMEHRAVSRLRGSAQPFDSRDGRLQRQPGTP